MYKGTTPTFTLTLPESVDLTAATGVYVTFAKKDGTDLLQKTGEDLDIQTNVISVFLTQEETLAFPTGGVLLQVNWTYREGGLSKRACSEVKLINLQRNLEDEVLA